MTGGGADVSPDLVMRQVLHKIVKRDTEECIPSSQPEECSRMFEFCNMIGLCQIIYVAAPLVWLCVPLNLATFIYLVKKDNGSGVHFILKFTTAVGALYALLLPCDILPNYIRTPFYYVEVMRYTIQNIQPTYYLALSFLDMLHRYCYVLICKDRFMKLWRPELRGKLSKRRGPVLDVGIVMSLTSMYLLPTIFLSGSGVDMHCSQCYGLVSMTDGTILDDNNIDDRDWLLKFFYRDTLPPILRNFIPCGIIFFTNIVIDPSDTKNQNHEPYDRRTNVMFKWVANLHLAMSVLEPYKYIHIDLRNQMGYRNRVRFEAVRLGFTGIGTAALPVVYFSFQLYQLVQKKRSTESETRDNDGNKMMMINKLDPVNNL